MPIVSHGWLKEVLHFEVCGKAYAMTYVTLQDVVWTVFYTMVALQWLKQRNKIHNA